MSLVCLTNLGGFLMSQKCTNLTVLNTRPFHQSIDLNEALIQKGFQVIPLPTMEIRPANTNWQSLLGDIRRYQKLIFTSTNAVEFAFQSLPKDMVNYHANAQFYAIGQATARALRQHIDREPIVPDNTVSEGMLADEALLNVAGEQIALFKGIGGRTLLKEALISRQAHVQAFSTYERCKTEIDPAYIDTICRHKQVNLILITSVESFTNFMSFFPENSYPWLFGIPVITLSERIGNMIEKQGFQQVILTKPADIVSTIACYASK